MAWILIRSRNTFWLLECPCSHQSWYWEHQCWADITFSWYHLGMYFMFLLTLIGMDISGSFCLYTSQFYIPFNNLHTYVKLSWHKYGIRMVSFRKFNIQRVFHLVISTKYQYLSGITILVLVMILFVVTIHSPIYWSNIDEHLILHTVNSMKWACRQLAVTSTS